MNQEINLISSLTKLDYVRLRSTLHIFENKRFDCNHCLKIYSTRQDASVMTQRERETKACQKILDKPLHRIGDNLLFNTCIGNFYDESVGHILASHSQFEKGVMPYPGSYFEQPNKIIEAFGVIASLKHENERLNQLAQRSAIKGRAINGRRR